MGTKISVGQLVKNDMEKAAPRIIATQATKAMKTGLLAALGSKGMSGPKVDAVREFFESDIGEALLREATGLAITYMPIKAIQENKYAGIIAEELRVSGMETAGNFLIGSAMEHIAPGLEKAMQSLPSLEIVPAKINARVEEVKSAPSSMAEELAEHMSEDSTESESTTKRLKHS
jgi:hypothetical protein